MRAAGGKRQLERTTLAVEIFVELLAERIEWRDVGVFIPSGGVLREMPLADEPQAS